MKSFCSYIRLYSLIGITNSDFPICLINFMVNKNNNTFNNSYRSIYFWFSMSVLILLNVKEKNFTSTLSTSIAKKLTLKDSKSKILLIILVGKKQNVCTRQQNKQANKFFCEIFVECMHFVSVLHIVFASPVFL